MTEITRKTSDFILVNPNTIHINIDPETIVKNKYYEPNKPYWLYALKLDHGRYYVGFTGKHNPYDRIMEHVDGGGAVWTKLHKPLEVLEVRYAGEITATEVKLLERNLTWVYMMQYGVNKVRGGVFNSPKYILRVGKNSVFMSYAINGVVCVMLLAVTGTYIVLRHYFNWW